MDTITIILVIIFLFIAYKIYKAIEGVSESNNELKENVIQSLVSISNSIYNLSESKNNDNELGSFLSIPLDLEELNKRKETLAKSYANYLVNTEGCSTEDAALQANFQIDKFGVEKVLREINWDKALCNSNSEIKFVNSDFFKNQINNFWTTGWEDDRYINPIDLFRPIYEFIKESNYKIGNTVSLNKNEDDSSYSYIKNRAILSKLKKLGIIKFSDNKSSDNIFDSSFVFVSADLDEIKAMINKEYSNRKHYLSRDDNEEYDDYLAEHPSSEKMFVRM